MCIDMVGVLLGMITVEDLLLDPVNLLCVIISLTCQSVQDVNVNVSKSISSVGWGGDVSGRCGR